VPQSAEDRSLRVKNDTACGNKMWFASEFKSSQFAAARFRKQQGKQGRGKKSSRQ
jgi:hypothetical protein